MMHCSLYIFPLLAKVELRTQGSRPRTQKKMRTRPRVALPRTDFLEAKHRNAQGQGHRRKCSQKKKSSKNFLKRLQIKKNVFKNFFQLISKRGKQKKSSRIFCEVFLAVSYILTIQKIVLSSSQGQSNF